MQRNARITAAAALTVLAYLHLHLAPAYDLGSSGAVHGVVLRGVAALGIVCAVVVLQFDHLVVHLAGLTASAALTAVAVAHHWVALPRYGPVVLAAATVAVAATGHLTAFRAVAAREHRKLRVSLGAYVLGGVDTRERGVLDAHLRSCSRCRTEAAALAPVAGLLGRAGPTVAGELLPRHSAAPTWTVPAPRREGQTAAGDVPKSG